MALLAKAEVHSFQEVDAKPKRLTHEHSSASISTTFIPFLSIQMEGYLHKRGRGRNISIYKPYARRYFVLNPETHELSYFSDDSKKSYRGMVSILDCEVEEISKAISGKSFCFDLKCSVGKPHEEIITLGAPNDSQLVEWITKIEEFGHANVIWLPDRVKIESG